MNAVLKIENNTTGLALTRQLELGPLFIEDTENILKNAIVDIFLTMTDKIRVFDIIAYIGQHDIINCLLTELNNDIEYGVDDDISHAVDVNNFIIDLTLP